MTPHSPARPAVPRSEARRLVTAVLTALLTVLALGLAGAVPARAAADYAQGVDATGSGSVRVWFTPSTPASLVDVHYLSSGAGGQNFRMTERRPALRHPALHLHRRQRRRGGGGGGTGSFPIAFQNNTRGTYTNPVSHTPNPYGQPPQQ
ncbi:hypothetical protein [Streptomyces sp. R35]|uniref:CBM56 domain-containing protein n=1 Tax=Streptomyces sp. R35 TaxID=3238630 RepID=A0AB39SP33_9ACTN